MRRVLLIEDDEIYIALFQRTIRHADLALALDVEVTAEAALEHLRELRKTAETPDLVVLDLKLPRMDGHRFLEILRGDPALADLPVVVSSTSDHPSDVTRAEARGIEGYFLKHDPYPLIDYLKRLDAAS